jgi:hypothetical protein
MRRKSTVSRSAIKTQLARLAGYEQGLEDEMLAVVTRRFGSQAREVLAGRADTVDEIRNGLHAYFQNHREILLALGRAELSTGTRPQRSTPAN